MRRHLLQGRVPGLLRATPHLLSGFLAQFRCRVSAKLRWLRAASVETHGLSDWAPLGPVSPSPYGPCEATAAITARSLQPPLAGDMSYVGHLTSRPKHFPCSDHSMARPGLGCHFPGTFTHFYITLLWLLIIHKTQSALQSKPGITPFSSAIGVQALGSLWWAPVPECTEHRCFLVALHAEQPHIVVFSAVPQKPRGCCGNLQKRGQESLRTAFSPPSPTLQFSQGKAPGSAFIYI